MKHANEPSPLAASDPDIARLFASLDADAPPPDAEAAILARLDDSPPPPPSSLVPKIWILRGGVVLTGILGVVIAMRSAPKSPIDIHTPAPLAVSAAPAAPHREETPATPSVAVEDLPTAPLPRIAAPLPSAAAHVEAKDSFREQLALLESARHSLAQGNAGDCLTTLARYDATYPAGLFATEVRLVRVDALLAAGQPARAEALARELLASDPHGAYAGRLHSLFPQIGGTDR